MQTWIALLRAVNVGGTGKLPMADLRALCERAGFTDVRTLIASGNVVLRSPGDERLVRSRLEAALLAYAGKPVGVLVRAPAELGRVLADNPFQDSPGNRVLAMFLDAPPPDDALDGLRHRTTERLALGTREIYIDYRDADTMRGSRLALPVGREGTTRNMNTIARLLAMADG
ncbi:DUF1697 domain-containing protein [Luteimonas kalidii]|uniref:DUF1697 domain-containing protein n=1 Tax=Luteimonas kalidii TaxID=3042025 RepID=A0ABT6JPQ7_9GAMM|nr:DUF1697 domain-containing protein [Luteimonas kalidii]MDH5832589.1 DUF1697 domain-containing protein [Luteimonas kalidii]